MELQWPLILFTTFLAWSAGLFGTQGAAALSGEGKRAQMPALVVSAVLLVVGGIAVFFHLEHWERIFNGFGNPTSGITQELICIVVMAVLMVIMFVMLRNSAADEDAPAFPKWLAVLAIVAAVLLVIVSGHSYMMGARPAWNSVLGPLSLLGAACALGPLSFAVIEAVRGNAAGKCVALASLVGSIANAVLTAAYIFAMDAAKETFTQVDYYYDPTHPTANIADLTALSPLVGESVPMVVVAVIAVIIPIVAAVLGKRTGNWKLWGGVGIVCAVIAAVALRMAFYSTGASMFLLF